MVEQGFLTCNTASYQLLDELDLRRLSPTTVRHGSHLLGKTWEFATPSIGCHPEPSGPVEHADGKTPAF